MRPHRSLILWLGLTALAFLLWAWVDAHFHDSTLGTNWRTGPTTHRLWIGNCGGSVTFVLESHRHEPSSTAPPPIDFERHLIGTPGLDWFTGPQFYTNDERDIPASDFYVGSAAHIPHWLLVFAYLFLWSLAFAWRHRRIKRHLTKSSSPSPAQPQTDLKISA
jgi:hypothetical protein